MVIRRDQMDAFDGYAQGNFEQRLAEHVRTRYADRPVGTSAGACPVSGLSADCLLQMVRYSIDKAREYGITWESVSWETVSWENVTWQTVTWDSVTWERLLQ